MKVRILFQVCALFLSINSFAQIDTSRAMERNHYDNRRSDTKSYQVGDSARNDHWSQTRDSMRYGNGFIVENGKTMMMRNGVKSALNSDTTLSNGVVITTSGTVVTKDGTKRTLKEGEFVNMGGNITPMQRGKGQGEMHDRNNRGDRQNEMRNMHNNGQRDTSMQRNGNRDMKNYKGTSARDSSMNKNRDMYRGDRERERNRVRMRDTTNRKKDMYLVPDSAKDKYMEKK